MKTEALQKFTDFVVDFLKYYELFDGDFKLSPFDQFSWDTMIWEYWKSLQTCSVVHDDAESQYFYNGRTGVALSTKKFLNYFAMQRDKSRSCGIPNTNDLIEPVLSEDFLTITDFALAKKMELIEELKGRNNPLSLLPAGPVFFDDSDLILKSFELSEAYKDIKTFLEHFVRLTSDYFVSPKPRDPMGEIIWGLPRKPNKESDTSEVEKSTRRVAPLEITINGVPIGSDFSTYVAQKRSETVQNKTEVRKTEPLKEEPRVWLPQNDRDSTVLISTPCSRIDDVCQRFEKYFLERVNSSECVHPLVPGSVSEAVEKHTEYLEEKELYSAAENIKKHRNPTSKDEVEKIAEKNGVRNNAGEKPEKIEVKSVDLNPLHGLEDTSFGTHPHPLEGNLDPVAFNTSGPYPEDAVEDVDAELEDDFGKESTNHKLPWNRISIPVATEKPTKAPAKKGQKKEKTGVVNSPKTATPPVASPPMTLSTPQHELDLNHDTQLGFQAMHFLSVLLLKCAAWVAQTDFEHVVAAFLQERAYRFVSGRWGLDAVEAPLKCPRVLITLVDQTYTVQGGCDWVRRIFLIQPENKSFQHWFTSELQILLHRTVETIPVACEPYGCTEALRSWTECGKFRPRLTSVHEVLRCITKMFEESGQPCDLGIQLGGTASENEPNRPPTPRPENGAPPVTKMQLLNDLLLFPAVSILLDPFDQQGLSDSNSEPHDAELLSHWEIFSSQKRSSSNVFLDINPRTLATNVIRQAKTAKVQGQKKIILRADAGIDWEDDTYFRMAVGLQVDHYMVDGFNTRTQKKLLQSIKTYSSSYERTEKSYVH